MRAYGSAELLFFLVRDGLDVLGLLAFRVEGYLNVGHLRLTAGLEQATPTTPPFTLADRWRGSSSEVCPRVLALRDVIASSVEVHHISEEVVASLLEDLSLDVDVEAKGGRPAGEGRHDRFGTRLRSIG